MLKTIGISLDAGDSVMAVAGVGGGYGNPLEREPEAVHDDVIDGYVSIDRAREEYSVVIDPVNYKIDAKATSRLRHKRSAK